MKIQAIKVNQNSNVLNKPQPVSFAGAVRQVVAVDPGQSTVSFLVDDSDPSVTSTCNLWVTTVGVDIQGSPLGQIGINRYVTSDCFA
jgi:hypothetical protein